MTRLEQRTLHSYLHFRERSMSVLALMWYNRRVYTIAFLGFCLLTCFAHTAFGAVGAGLVAVAFLAMILRDISWYRRSIAIWPILQQVFDWNKIEQLTCPKEPGNT